MWTLLGNCAWFEITMDLAGREPMAGFCSSSPTHGLTSAKDTGDKLRKVSSMYFKCHIRHIYKVI